MLIVGLGSVGRRHAENLFALGVTDVVACRIRGEPVGGIAATVRTHSDLETALTLERPDAVLVTNPTALHLPVALAAARRGCHLYIEKPLADTLAHVDDLEALVAEHALVAMVGCNLRFHPAYRRLKALIADGAIGRPLAARFEVGHYLPEWHPWEDYRQGYSARARLGGGVVLTLIHELDFAYDLFGDVSRVAALTAKASHLDTDVEDLAEILLEFRSGMLASVHMNHVQRPAARRCRLIGESGTADWDVLTGDIVVARDDRRERFTTPAEWNESFSLALAHFLECVTLGKVPSPSLAEGRRVLEVALAAKQAAATRTFVPV